jgi:hypothetical protein
VDGCLVGESHKGRVQRPVCGGLARSYEARQTDRIGEEGCPMSPD